jgi:glycerol kinase
MWSEQDVRAMWREAARYEPRMSADQRETLLADWRRAVDRSRGWVDV